MSTTKKVSISNENRWFDFSFFKVICDDNRSIFRYRVISPSKRIINFPIIVKNFFFFFFFFRNPVEPQHSLNGKIMIISWSGEKKSSLPLSTRSQKKTIRKNDRESSIIAFHPYHCVINRRTGWKKVNTREVENEKWGRETNVRLVSYQLIRDISCKKFFFFLQRVYAYTRQWCIYIHEQMYV